MYINLCMFDTCSVVTSTLAQHLENDTLTGDTMCDHGGDAVMADSWTSDSLWSYSHAEGANRTYNADVRADELG
jgi:hypothetical protein